jgi:transcriptional regulator NrdR family protein
MHRHGGSCDTRWTTYCLVQQSCTLTVVERGGRREKRLELHRGYAATSLQQPSRMRGLAAVAYTNMQRVNSDGQQ